MSLYKEYIKEVIDFPEKGISFKDISPLLANEGVFKSAIRDMGERIRIPDYWVGIDSRGFIFASALSIYYGGGVVMCRKKGKLPPPVSEMSYELEYGESTLEIKDGMGRVVIIDDVLATGGTMMATNELVKNAGYHIIENLVLVDLKYVPRVDNFNLNVRSLISYE